MLCAACCRRHSALRRPVTAAVAAAAAAASAAPRTATAAASFSTSLHAVRLPLPKRAAALTPTFGTAFVRHSSAAASAPNPTTSSPSTASTTSTTAAVETPSASTTALSKPPDLDPAESQVWDVLVAALAPTALSVRDISGGCGSMYGIEVSAAQFRGLSVLKQQRMVNAALGDLVKGWHGVQVTTRVP